MRDRRWVPAEYDYGYIDSEASWVVLRRGGDFYRIEPPPWKIYARVSDSDDARRVLAAMRGLQ
jgi:hypothetical protein